MPAINDEFERDVFELVWVEVLGKPAENLVRNGDEYAQVGASMAWAGWKIRAIAESHGLLQRDMTIYKSDSVN